jgi:putative endonuclease
MSQHNQLGKWGENIACDLLITKGYSIVARNIRIAHVEIDILAMIGNRIAVVEVKTRQDDNFDPIFAITSDKIRRLARAGATYTAVNGLPHEIQIDLITIVGTPDTQYKVTHYPDHYLPPSKRR